MASYNATLQLEYLSGSTSYLWYSHKFNKLYEKGLYQFILSMAHSPFFVKAQPMWLSAMVKVKWRQPTHVLSVGVLPLGFWLGDFKTTWTVVLTQHMLGQALKVT